ncbi:MAG: hypothetical protein WC879_07810 [Melioribacteraceae bacterium]
MKKSFFLLLMLSIILEGCMMLGMGGMGHTGGGGMQGDSHGSSMTGKTIVKESIVNGIKITAEFPPYTLSDELAYKVTLYDVREKIIISDASISLIVTSNDSRSQGSRSGQASSHSGHGDSSPTQSQGKVEKMKFSPDEINNGTYIFHPTIKNKGTYKFIFVLEKVGNVAIDPPIEVEQTVQLYSRMDQPSEHSGDNMAGFSLSSPVILIGLGAMAIMMLFILR